MTPTLYKKTETVFTGVGMPLTECVKCEITEERNGAFDGELSYPVDGVFYDEITYGAIIKTKSNQNSSHQLFRIQKIIKMLGGIVTYYLTHISYELNGYPLYPGAYTNLNPDEALQLAVSRLTYVGSELYTAWSNITTKKTITTVLPRTMRSFLGGADGSILDHWKTGEYEFDNRVIKFHAARGADNGVTIAYGKNMIDLNQEENIEESYTHLMPYAYNDGQLYYGTTRSIELPNAVSMGHFKALVKEFSFESGETPSSALLTTKANKYITDNDPGKLRVNLTVEFIPLSQTTEYDEIAPLEEVNLCDIVTVIFPKLGVSAKAKVIKTIYDSLREKYISIEIGDAKTDIVDAIKSIK